MKTLITGATGFVGRYLTENLCKKGTSVRVLLRSKLDGELDCSADVEIWKGDVTRPETLRGIGDGVDTVYHLAAMGHVSAISEKAYRQFYAVNVQGTENLMHAIAGGEINKFVHFSSTAAMGLIRKRLVDETDTPEPSTPYQKSKLQSEFAALRLGKELNIPTVVLRPCMIYGPGGYGEFHKMATLMKKSRFPKVGSGLNLTPLVHVEDVIQAAVKASEKGGAGEIYLVASKKSLPMDQLREMILSAWGQKALYPYVPTWLMFAAAWGFELLSRLNNRPPLATRRNIANTVWDREFSIGKSQIELGYAPSVDFEKGIHQTVKWYWEQAE